MEYFSQYQQDKILNESYFKNKSEGVFVDIGAHDGITLSNTYFFEKYLNWKGLCIEPLQKAFDLLKTNRKCEVVNGCAWIENTVKTFRSIDGYSEMLSGLVDCYDPQHIKRIETESAGSGGQVIVDSPINCYDINDLLEKNKLFTIDLLSVDIEGGEFELIKHINLDRFDANVILVENNYNDNNLREYLFNIGYNLDQRLGVDDVFVRPRKKRNHFSIIIPSYNNEEWCNVNVESIIAQDYKNYNVLYIDDASKDNTNQIVSGLIKNEKKWTLVRNEENMRRGYNISPYNQNVKNFITNDEDILVFVDGDDWLPYPNVLNQLNDFYNKNDCWMTYGTFICYPSLLKGTPQSTHYPDVVHDNNAYRKDVWRASHLRTFKWWLYKRIKEEDLIYSKTGKHYFHAEDLASSYPCLEMCPKEKIGVVNFVSYMFNESPSNRSRGVSREQEAGYDLEAEIRNKKPYDKIKL